MAEMKTTTEFSTKQLAYFMHVISSLYCGFKLVAQWQREIEHIYRACNLRQWQPTEFSIHNASCRYKELQDFYHYEIVEIDILINIAVKDVSLSCV